MASYRWLRFKKKNMMPSIPVTSTERSSKAQREMSRTSETSKEKKKAGAKRFSKSFIPKKEDSPNPTQSERNTMSLTPTQSEDNRNILIPTLSEDNTKILTPTQFEDNTNVLIPTQSKYKILLRGGFDRPTANTNKTKRRSPTPDHSKENTTNTCGTNTKSLSPNHHKTNTKSLPPNYHRTNTKSTTRNPYWVNTTIPPSYPYIPNTKSPTRNPYWTNTESPPLYPYGTNTENPPPYPYLPNTKSPTRNPYWTNTESPPLYPYGTNTENPPSNPYWTNTKSPPLYPYGTNTKSPPPYPYGRNTESPPPYPYGTDTESPPPYPFGTDTESPPLNSYWTNIKNLALNSYEPKTNRLTRSTYCTENLDPNTSLVDTMRRYPSRTYSDSLLRTHLEKNTGDLFPMSPEEIMDCTNLLPGGLPNLGSTCYVNSSLQCLFTAEAFCKELIVLNNCKNNEQSPFLRCFVELSKLRETWPVQCDTKDLLMELIQLAADTQLEFSFYQQNDAHEFLLHCLTKLEQSGTWLGAVDPVRSNFIFKMRNIITCLRCKSQQKSKIEENRHIFLPLVHSSVNQCLDGMLNNSEVLQCKCESCGADYASSRWAFHTLPRFLIIQLNRFCMEVSRIVKLRTPINIDPELKIHCPSRSDTPGTKNSKAKASQSDRNDPGGSTTTYRLISVLSHVGSELNSGHYVSDCSTHNADQWKHYNDQEVSLTTEAAVLMLRSSDAYVLLYEKE